MSDRKPRFTPLSPAELPVAEEDEFFCRAKLAKRWDCSEKAVLRAEKRLGLHPYRFLRAIKYRLSDVLRVEREALQKMPKKFTGLRSDQKAELRRRDSPGALDPEYPDDKLLEITLPANLKLTKFRLMAQKADSCPWNEWIIPARVLNKYAKVRVLNQ